MATSTRHHIKGGQNLVIDYSIMQSQEALGLIVEHPSPQKGGGGVLWMSSDREQG